MSMRKLSIILFLILLVGTASATPPLMIDYQGSVTIDGNDAPTGTEIVAKINWNERGSIITTIPGHYGATGNDIDDRNLAISATEEDLRLTNPEITFWVDSKIADQRIPLTADMQGRSFSLDLTVMGGMGPEKPAGSGEGDFGIEGVSTEDAGGKQVITIKKGGDQTLNFDLDGNTITMTDTGSGWSRLTVETEGTPSGSANGVTGVVAGVTAESSPISGDVGGAPVTASFVADMSGMPDTDSGITSTITRTPDSASGSAFQIGVKNAGKQINEIAYTLNIIKSGIANAGDGGLITSATIRMAVSPSWVQAHGGKDKIIIYRRADGADVATPLETRFMNLDADGNYVFEADSPEGLSVFALIAETTKSSPGSGGGSGGSYSSPVIQPTATPVVVENQTVTTSTSGISIMGATLGLDAEGKTVISIDRAISRASAQELSLDGRNILIKTEGFIITVKTDGITDSENIVSGVVVGVRISSESFSSNPSGLGNVAVSYETELASVPGDNAELATTLASEIPGSVSDAFAGLAGEDGEKVGDVAYVLSVRETAIPETSNATIMMSLPDAWVESHGGSKNIRILRMADDGTAEILPTTSTGNDEDGNTLFSAESADGLCYFGIASMKAARTGEVPTPTGGSETTPDEGGIPGIALIGVLLLIVAMGGVYFYTKGRKD